MNTSLQTHDVKNSLRPPPTLNASPVPSKTHSLDSDPGQKKDKDKKQHTPVKRVVTSMALKFREKGFELIVALILFFSATSLLIFVRYQLNCPHSSGH